MIGLFDSGAGGLATLAELRALCPSADICFFADRENAPYGTKDRDTLVRLVRRDIEILRSAGADKILMACCTASTVYPLLNRAERDIAVPIIAPAARAAARATKNGKVGVISTRATHRSGAFGRALRAVSPSLSVTEWEAQELVALIEGGVSDEDSTPAARAKIARLVAPAIDAGIDTLILGCTHFPRVGGIIASCLPSVTLVSSAREGALEIAKSSDTDGCGATIYL